jgi:hypothetical protein
VTTLPRPEHLLGLLTDLGRQRRVRWGLAAAAVVTRIVPFVYNRSLWLDEAAMADEILRRPASVLDPGGQLAHLPPAFTWALLQVTHGLGGSEQVLRLLPLVCGLASVALFFILAARLLAPAALVVALLLFAVSDQLVYYSAELKPYAGDVTAALLLLVAAPRLLAARPRAGALASWALLGAAAVWWSHGSVFVLAGVALAATVAAWRARDWPRLIRLSGVYACWAVSIAVLYRLALVHGTRDAGLQYFWGFAFMPIVPRSVPDVLWYPDSFIKFFRDPGGFVLPGVAAFAAIVGGAALWRKDAPACALLLSSIPFVLIASALRVYPTQGRLLLFLVPMALILIAAGVEAVAASPPPHGIAIGAALLLLVAVPSTATAAFRLFRPLRHEDIKPVLQHVQERWQPGDQIYVYYGALPAFDYYAGRYGLADAPVIRGVASRDDWTRYAADVAGLRGRPRVWIVFSHVYDWGAANEERLVLFWLDRIGTRLDAFQSKQASAYLYGFAEP